MDKKQNFIHNLPNALTLFRIVIAFLIFILSFVYIGFLYSSDSLNVASYNDFNLDRPLFLVLWIFILLLFIVGVVTDWLDGYIARKFNVVTKFGKFLDPIADKILVNGVLIFFSIIRVVPAWVTVLFIVRDIFVNGMRLVLAEQNIVVSASKWGKIKTVAQFVGIVVIFLLSPIYGVNMDVLGTTGTIQYRTDGSFWFPWLTNIPLLIGLFFSLFSGTLYLKSGFVSLKGISVFSSKQK